MALSARAFAKKRLYVPPSAMSISVQSMHQRLGQPPVLGEEQANKVLLPVLSLLDANNRRGRLHLSITMELKSDELRTNRHRTTH